MKFFIFSIFVLTTSILNAQSISKYMNNISEVAANVRSASWSYTNSVSKSKSAVKVEKDRQTLIKTIEESVSEINKIGSFEGISYYKDSVLSFLKTYKEVIVVDYENIKSIELNAKHKFDLKDKYIQAKEDANSKMLQASDMLDAVESRFATENKVKLLVTKSKVAERLKKANKVYKYYNSVFLLFFKPYYEEALFLQALDSANIEQMEFHNSELASFSKANLSMLDLKLDFDGDNSLINSCKSVLLFYQSEAEKNFLKIIEFQKFKAAYKKTKSDLEAKSSAEREKGEVAAFNKLVEEYNQRMNEYNQLILDLNTKRETLINSWNIIGSDFEDKHLN